MQCTRCGNPISSHSNVCPICQYVLSEDEYREGIEEDQKRKNPKHKTKPKKEIKPKEPKPIEVKTKPTNPKINESNASEVTIINDSSRTYTETKNVSAIRFIGYLLFLVADAAFVYGLWNLWYSVDFGELALGLGISKICLLKFKILL